MLTAQQIANRVDMLRTRDAARMRAMRQVKAVREGEWDKVMPGMFPDGWDKPVVSNMVDIAARDFADNLGPLPTFECKSANATSDRARKFSDKRTRIARYYAECSNLQDQQHDAANRLVTYAFCAYVVEPDFAEKMPKIRVLDNFGAFYELDPWDRYTLQYANILRCWATDLAKEFPEAEARLLSLIPRGQSDREVELVVWYDTQQKAMVTLEGNILLSRQENPVQGKCMVRVVELPKLGKGPRGQFDDVIPVQLARGLMQIYLLEATERSVYAPMALPDDVQELNYGPDSYIRSATPEKAQKIALPIPAGLFPESQVLEREQRIGSRYPEGRTGNVDASIITGQGVEALMGAFNEGIKSAQQMFAQAIQDIISLCFETDQKLWPNLRKSVVGQDFGSPYEITYTPAKDINNDFSVSVTYGMTAGLDPNRALVFVLQALSAGLISTRTAREQLPVDINISAEELQIDIEAIRSSLATAIAGYAQAIPMLATNGQDPAQAVNQLAEVLRLRQKGDSIEEAVSKVFAPPPPEEAAPEANVLGAPPAPAGQPPMAGGGQPGTAEDLLMTLTGLTPGGNPNLQSTVSRRTPI